MSKNLYTIDDVFSDASPYFNGAPSLDLPPGAENVFTEALNPATLQGGELQGNTVVQDGYLQSSNYVQATSGWKLFADGTFEALSATINGAITAITGAIGGFTIGTDYLRDAADSFGLASTVTGGDDVRFWAGDTFANRGSADFRVTESGAVTASSLTMTGGSVGSSVSVAIGALNVAARGWTQTSVFSVSDADTVAWGAGTFTSADGTAYSINSGNTGNMAAATYIYLDTAVSTTAYQTTTTAATAVGAGKVLIAKAQNGTGEATFQVFGGIGGQNIDASSIVAGSITANELSTSIVYAGSIVIDTAGLIRSGQTSYNTGTGWWIGNDSGTPKLSIGDSSGYRLTWDGSNLEVITAQNLWQSAILPWTSGLWTDADGNVSNYNHTYANITMAGGGGNVQTIYSTNDLYPSFTFAKDVQVTFRATMSGTSGAAADGIGFGLVSDSGISSLGVESPSAGADKHSCQFYVDFSSGNIYARTMNDGVVTDTSLSGVTIATTNLYKIEFISGTSCKFFVNGVLKATNTTNLPTDMTVKFGIGRGRAGSFDIDNISAPQFLLEF